MFNLLSLDLTEILEVTCPGESMVVTCLPHFIIAAIGKRPNILGLKQFYVRLLPVC